MSLKKTGAQPENPLGGGEKAEASNNNRMLYGLLAVLVVVFMWKASSDDNETKDIPQSKITTPYLFFEEETVSKDLNPNIEVEIEEAVIPETKKSLSSSGIRNAKSGNDKKSTSSTEKQENGSGEQSMNENQESYPDPYQDDSRLVDENYSYIFAEEVEVSQGAYRGLDENGFAITRIIPYSEKKNMDSYSGVNLVPIFEDPQNFPQSRSIPVFVPKTEQLVIGVTTTKEKTEEYPTTGIHYGETVYPLKDTLSWHYYESLPYIKEEKEIFVAEKVRAMPTSDDLEPNIHPSTLGDRDTRMGFGVVIRPNK